MTDALVHRGPDDFGYLLLDSRGGRFQIGQAAFDRLPCDVCLGNRRLSIIDLSPNGRQPIHNETSDAFVVFNGAIFNHPELRDELAARGHIFRSRTDTEVIIHAYEEWGADCVARFNGMWAFAIWDQRSRELFCSRDRFGIKPFYYYLDDSVFLFASEIKGLLPAMETRPRADYGVLSDYLIDRSLCRTRDTFFEGIKRLEPAHNLFVSASGVRTRRHWDYRTQSEVYDDRRPVETFRNLLDDAVRLRLRSDVPVGVALSGGLDSTSILASAARLIDSQKTLKAFTAVFPGEAFDESEFARLASQACGAELLSVNYRPEHFIEDLQKVIWSMDYPALSSQVLPRWQLMRVASRSVKVILEGQGADEMLAGYVDRYFAPYLMDELERIQGRQSGLTVRTLVRSCWEAYRQHGRSVYTGSVWRLAHKSLPAAWQRRPTRTQVYTGEFAATHSSRPRERHVREFDDRLTDQLHHDHMTRMLPMLLKFGDALSMASSIESRLPFLDHRLVEFVFRLPARYKLDGARSKVLLRDAMAGAIPERIRSRRDKIGFRTPLSRWIGQSLDSHVRPILLSRRCKDRGILDPKKIERLLAPQAQRPPGVDYSIFCWLSVELWFRLFIDAEEMPKPRLSLLAPGSACSNNPT